MFETEIVKGNHTDKDEREWQDFLCCFGREFWFGELSKKG
jgi:hypothetical protein